MYQICKEYKVVVNIYKSRNLIYVLDLLKLISAFISTKVEILYMYQIYYIFVHWCDLQKQKSYICIRFFPYSTIASNLQKQKSYICIRFYISLYVYFLSTKVEILYMYQMPAPYYTLYVIYKSRNLIYVLDYYYLL